MEIYSMKADGSDVRRLTEPSRPRRRRRSSRRTASGSRFAAALSPQGTELDDYKRLLEEGCGARPRSSSS